MRKTGIVMLASFAAAMLLLIVAVALSNNKGIVILEGYEHGVALCEEEYHTVVHHNDASVWNDGIATYVVNAGHYEDPEVKQLTELAHTECAKLKEER